MHCLFWRLLGCTLSKNCFWLQFHIQHRHVQIHTVMCTYHAILKHNLHTQQYDFMHDSCPLYGDCFLWQLQSCFFSLWLLLFIPPFFCNVHKEMYVSFLCSNRSSICCRIHPVRVCSFGCLVLPWFCCL